MQTKLTPIRMPIELIQSIDSHVGRRNRSKFIIEATERELIRQRQFKALQEGIGAGVMKEEDHPELPATIEGMNEYIRKLRAEAERHYE